MTRQADFEESPTRHRLDLPNVYWSKTWKLPKNVGAGISRRPVAARRRALKGERFGARQEPSQDHRRQHGALFGNEKMDDFFIAEYFDWKVKRNSYIDRFVNRALGKVGLRIGFPASFILDKVDTIVGRAEGRLLSPLHSGGMTNVEQRINMYHLVSQVLVYGVEGDFVELGCNSGESSVLITKVIQVHNSD